MSSILSRMCFCSVFFDWLINKKPNAPFTAIKKTERIITICLENLFLFRIAIYCKTQLSKKQGKKGVLFQDCNLDAAVLGHSFFGGIVGHRLQASAAAANKFVSVDSALAKLACHGTGALD